eukprot:CAMPEP_0197314852 /NCGR_PEP_ID=MMETSP0891-20130614/35480_1 /TAXON_ID=44058 ORGANISM="Aureoumbra lagunensis, Strain CCMP1510" /NCGR_SAMPLE_ID=MMETSP0891 /ASSEMBLY_ACC=CAM_ASM_000534 /LENGTH=536 /DNA_ID=CAMNT_0042803495 /DNA_START=65 /DNA_END=1675 /DNA_ORIENTATION=-
MLKSFWFEDWFLRVKTWFRLLLEYNELKKVYQSHVNDNFFIYGESTASPFSALSSHKAFLDLKQYLCGVNNDTKSELKFIADYPVLPTYLPIEEGAAACLGVLGLACADLYQSRGGEPQLITVKQSDAGLATAGYMFLEYKAEPGYHGCRGFKGTIAQEGTVNPTRKAYTCGDGRSIFLHGGFPKLRTGILDFFRINNQTSDILNAMTVAVSSRPHAQTLEIEMRNLGLAATLCRTPHEWRATEQGKAIAALPPFCLEIVQSNKSQNKNFLRILQKSTRPLSDIIVIDFSHVIASPMVGRTLAEHGATVFKIFTQKRPRRKLFDEETNSGKIPFHLNLETDQDKERLWDLLTVADVLIDGYTSGVLARFGFDDDSLFTKCPHLIYLRVSCYGHIGPWAKHKGFQQNANFATGVGTIEDEQLLCYQLTSQVDYTTGFLGAIAVIVALTKRQQAATNYNKVLGFKVYVSLCQTATWMAKFGAYLPTRIDFICRITRLLLLLQSKMISDGGNIAYLPPAFNMSLTPPSRAPGFRRWWFD